MQAELRQPLALICAAVLASAAVLAVCCVLALRWADAEGARNIQMLDDLAAENVAALLHMDLSVAQDAAAILGTAPVERLSADTALQDRLRRMVSRGEQVSNIIVVDPTGQVRLNALNPSLLYDVSEADFFHYFHDNGGEAPFLGGPYDRPVGREPVFGVAVRLATRAGGFGGVLVVVTTRSYLEAIFRQPRLYDTLVAGLVGPNSTVLAGTTGQSAALDVRDAVHANLVAGQDHGVIFGAIGPTTDERGWSLGSAEVEGKRDGIFSFRTVAGWQGTTVIVGAELAEIRAPAWRSIAALSALFATLVIPLTLVALAMVRSARRQAALLAHWQGRAALRPRAFNPLSQRKHEALTTLAAGVAHDLNNLLSVVSTAASLIDEATDDANIRAATGSLDAAAQRAADLARQLLAYGRRQMLLPTRFDLNTEITRIQPVLQSALLEGGMVVGGEPRQGSLTLELDRRALPVSLDPAQFAACMVALLDNARQASDDDVRVTIRTRLTGNREPDGVSPGAEPAAVVEVEDFGRGMNEDVVARAFDPFFTTRMSAVGMGLSVVHGFVHQTGGSIAVQSRPGEGTLVMLEFPLVAGRRVSDWPAGSAPSTDIRLRPRKTVRPLGTMARVLVVDDNDLVRGNLVRRLTQAGLTVLEASDAVGAREMHASGVDALVTDVVLPGDMDGFALARWFRMREPRLPLVFVSGFMSFRQPELLASDDLASFVRKPIDTVELLAVLEGLLAARDDPGHGPIVTSSASEIPPPET